MNSEEYKSTVNKHFKSMADKSEGIEEATVDTLTVSEQLDRVIETEEKQKRIWILYGFIAQEVGIDRKSNLKEIVDATVKYHEEHKKIMSEYQDIIKSFKK